mgnify:CR=1 FL=1
MSTPFESLDDALNISREDDVVDITPVGASPMKKRESRKPVEPTNKEEDREKDYQYARAHLYDLVEKMQYSCLQVVLISLISYTLTGMLMTTLHLLWVTLTLS